jgi:hypothetical protein
MNVVDEREKDVGSVVRGPEEVLFGLMISNHGMRIKIYADSIDEETAAWRLLEKLTPQLSLLRAALENKEAK